jgi:hypothetical protein
MPTPTARHALRRVEPLAKQVAQRVVPEALRFRIRLEGGRIVHVPRVGHVRWGGMRRLAPISRDNGYDRGTPIDRWFVEEFLRDHAEDIRGDVLDFYDDRNTRLFGGERVRSVEVVHRTPGHATATIAADLTDAPELASASFDCVLLTQTLHVIYDMRAALATVHRVLRPGGVVLATFPGGGSPGRPPSGSSRSGSRRRRCGPRSWATCSPPPPSCKASPPRSSAPASSRTWTRSSSSSSPSGPGSPCPPAEPARLAPPGQEADR